MIRATAHLRAYAHPMTEPAPPPVPGCSWCRKPGYEVHLLISGPEGTAICDACLYTCLAIADDKLGEHWEDQYRNQA